MVPPAGDGGSSAPIDRPILEFLQMSLQGKQVERAGISDTSGHLELRVLFASLFYPLPVDEASLSVRWYTNDDFKIHYQEEHPDHVWKCRWDRHPNPHNARGHFHPPPDAGTPGEDASSPPDYRDVLRLVFDDVEERFINLWDE